MLTLKGYTLAKLMIPPFTISDNMLNYIVDISQKIGQLQVQYDMQLHLRKDNRLRSIQSSLAIENNTLSLEQVTDIINGKRVLGAPKEIQEVKNAYDAYEYIDKLDPYNIDDFLLAHRLMTNKLVDEAGKFRHNDVGIYNDQGQVIHMGARPQFVPKLVKDLLDWARQSNTPALIKSAVVHYEIEVIHPFSDGNGRMGRLWQTVILNTWNPIFAWLPIETIVFEHQSEYYEVLGRADRDNDSTVFIEYMLQMIIQTLNGYSLDKVSDKTIDKMSDKIKLKLNKTEQNVYNVFKDYLAINDYIDNQQAQELLERSPATVRRYLAKFVKLGLLQAEGERKARVYRLVKD